MNSRIVDILVELLGYQKVQDIIYRNGGLHIWVPKPERVLSNQKICQIFGISGARKVCREFGEGDLFLPMTMSGASRNQYIAELHRSGYKIDAIAAKAGCHRRSVFRVLNKSIVEVNNAKSGKRCGSTVNLA